MRVAALLCRARVRRAWRPLLAVFCVVALGSAVTMASLAGARRVLDAHETFRRATNAADLGVSYGPNDPTEMAELVGSVDGVADATTFAGFVGMAPELPPDAVLFILGPSADPTVARPLVTEGRAPEAEHEVVLNRAATTRGGIGVGDTTTLVVADRSFQDFLPVTVEVVGVADLQDELLLDDTQAKPTMMVSPAFVAAHGERVMWGETQMVLADRVSRDAVTSQLNQLGVEPDEDTTRKQGQVRDSVQVLVNQLLGLAALAAVATIAIGSQVLVRIMRRTDADERTLAAVGVTPAQVRRGDALVAATPTVAGVGAGLVLAVFASVLFPVGSLRRFALLRGMEVDLVTLSLTALALAASVIASTVVVAGLRRRREGPVRPSRGPLPIGARPAASTGVRFAAAHRSSLPAVMGLSVGLAVVVGVLTFGGSLDRLIDDPARSGMTWDLVGKDSFAFVDLDAVTETAADRPELERLTAVSLTSGALLNGRPVPTAYYGSVVGSPWPPIVDGRAPDGPRQLLVGRQTMRSNDLRIGDTVSIGLLEFDGSSNLAVGRQDVEMEIVGTTVAPAIGMAGTDVPRLDVGILLQRADIEAALTEPVRTDVVLFDLADGTDPESFRDELFPEGLPDEQGRPTEWFTTVRPSEVTEAAAAQPAVAVGGGVLVAAVLATVVHTLSGFLRERRRAIVVLETIGFTRRQVVTTVLSHGLAIVAVALAVALPLGIALGRSLWQSFAARAGVVAHAEVPVLLLAGTTAGVLVLGAAVSLVPAALATRLPAADALRTE